MVTLTLSNVCYFVYIDQSVQTSKLHGCSSNGTADNSDWGAALYTA